MKEILIILLIVLISSCQPKKLEDNIDSIQYYYVNYNLKFYSEIYLDTTKFDLNVKTHDSIYTLTYLLQDEKDIDTLVFNLKEVDSHQPEYILNGKRKDYDDFAFVSSREYVIEGETFKVYKYASNPFVIDGCMTYFWTPEFGIIFKRSSTWRNFSKLQSNSKEINRKTNLLFDLVNQDTEFYKGCITELDLIPKSDIQEFYDWKFKE